MPTDSTESGLRRFRISWQSWHAKTNRVPPESFGLFGNIWNRYQHPLSTCITPGISNTVSSYLLWVSWIVCSPRCLFKDPRRLFEDPRLTNSPVPESFLRLQTRCLIKENLIRHSFSIHLQQAEAPVAPSARQIPRPQLQPVDCSDRALTPLPRRQQTRSATQARPEETLYLAGVELVVEVAATYSVEEQTSPRVDLGGALARRRVIMLPVVFLAPAKQDNNPV